MKLTLIVLMMLLPGCASDAIKTAVVKAEGVADSALSASESGVCSHASVRALMERYQTRERLENWFNFCYPGFNNPFAPMQSKLTFPLQNIMKNR